MRLALVETDAGVDEMRMENETTTHQPGKGIWISHKKAQKAQRD
jgi:hypothetical protein